MTHIIFDIVGISFAVAVVVYLVIDEWGVVHRRRRK